MNTLKLSKKSPITAFTEIFNTVFRAWQYLLYRLLVSRTKWLHLESKAVLFTLGTDNNVFHISEPQNLEIKVLEGFQLTKGKDSTVNVEPC